MLFDSDAQNEVKSLSAHLAQVTNVHSSAESHSKDQNTVVHLRKKMKVPSVFLFLFEELMCQDDIILLLYFNRC